MTSLAERTPEPQIIVDTCQICPVLKCPGCLDHPVNWESAVQCVLENAVDAQDAGKGCPTRKSKRLSKDTLVRDILVFDIFGRFIADLLDYSRGG